MKLYLDIETTGLSPTKNSIIEIGYTLVCDKNRIVHTNSVKMRPREGTSISDTALKINGFKKEDILNFPKVDEAIETFIKDIRANMPEGKATLIGFNSDVFDLQFLRNYLGDKRLYSLIEYKTIDLFKVVLWLQDKGLINTGKSQSLESCCEYFGIKQDMMHGAISDVLSTIRLDNKLEEVVNGKI